MAYKSPVDRLMSEFGKSYMRMSLKELEVYARRLQKIANRRYDTIVSYGGTSEGVEAMTSGPFNEFESSGGRISLRRPANQTPKERLAQLRHEVSRAQKFVNSAHSSIAAIRKMSNVRSSVIERVVGKVGYEYYKKTRLKNTSFEANFWHAVENYRNQYFANYISEGSEKIINMIYEIFWNHGRSKTMGSRALANIADAVNLMTLTQAEPEVAYEVLKNTRAEYNKHRRKDTRDITKLPREWIVSAAERVVSGGESYIDALRNIETRYLDWKANQPKKKRSSKKRK